MRIPEHQVVELQPQPVLGEVHRELKSIERQLYSAMRELVSKNPLWTEYLSKVRGVGPRLASYLIVKLSPARFDTVSKLYKYAGLHVEDGRAPRRKAGEKTGWNPEARTMMWRLGEKLRLDGGFYKMMYHTFYTESSAKHPAWTKGHVMADARRRTEKLFLSHWLYVGRAILGLEPVLPYSCAKEPALHHCVPPIIDKAAPEERERFYKLYLSKHFKKEDYDYWNKRLEEWLGETGEEPGEEEEEA